MTTPLSFATEAAAFYRSLETPDGLFVATFLGFLGLLWLVVRLTQAKDARSKQDLAAKVQEVGDCKAELLALRTQNRLQEIALATLYGLIRATHQTTHPFVKFPSLKEVLSGDADMAQLLVPEYTPPAAPNQ